MYEKKKKILLIPSAYNIRAFGDVAQFIQYYKDDYQINVLASNGSGIEGDGYNIIDSTSDKAEYLKYTSDYIIDSGSLRKKYKISPTSKWVSVWHGIPYKKMFIDFDPNSLADTISYADSYNQMISMSQYYTNTFLRSALMYDGEILEVGCSKMDNLFNKTETKIKELKDNLKIPHDKKIILYAPTFREKGEYNLPFDPQKLLNSINGNPDDFVLLVKLHYLSDLNTKSNKVIDCTNYSKISDLMLISDVLISDYSSLIMDYSVLNKPIILFQYDQEEYFNMRNVYFDFSDYMNPDQIVTNENDLYNILSKELDSDNSKMTEYFYPLEKGDSTKEIVEKIAFDNTPRNSEDVIFLVNTLNEKGLIHDHICKVSKHLKEKYNTKIIIIAINELNIQQPLESNKKLDCVDILLSAQVRSDACNTILKNTKGTIISLNFQAHLYFQQKIKKTNSIFLIKGFDDLNLFEKTKEDYIYHTALSIDDNSIDLYEDHVLAFSKINERNLKIRNNKISILYKVKRKIRNILKKTFPEYYNHRLINKEVKTIRSKIDGFTKLPLVSIIVTDINEQLAKTIELLNKQPYNNIEIIIVGPETIYNKAKELFDGIKFVCSNYTSTSCNFKLGLDQAKGELIYFLRQEEYLYPTALSNLVIYLIENDLKMVCGKSHGIKDLKKIFNKTRIDYLESRNEILNNITFSGKLFDRQLILEQEIINNKYFEKIVMVKLYSSLDKIGILNKDITKIAKVETEVDVADLENLIDVNNNLSNYLNDYQKIIMISSFFNDDMIYYLQEFNECETNQRKAMFTQLKDYFLENEKYYYSRLIKRPLNLRLIKYLTEDNYIMFKKVGIIYSISYYRKKNNE